MESEEDYLNYAECDEMSLKLRENKEFCVTNVLLIFLRKRDDINFVLFDEAFLRDKNRQKQDNDLDLLNECANIRHINGLWIALNNGSSVEYSKILKRAVTKVEDKFDVPNLQFNMRSPRLIQECALSRQPIWRENEIKIHEGLFAGLPPQVHCVDPKSLEKVICKFKESLVYCNQMDKNGKVIVILGELDGGQNKKINKTSKELIKRLFQSSVECCVKFEKPLNAYFHRQKFTDVLKEFKLIKENPIEFVQSQTGVLISDHLITEGYECPSVISFYGGSSDFFPTFTEVNFNMRCTANLVLFRKKEGINDTSWM